MALNALVKAESLRRHAAYLGVQASEFVLTLTDQEMREFLDFLAAGGMGEFEHQAMLLDDIKHAPLAVCSLFLGFEIMPVSELN